MHCTSDADMCTINRWINVDSTWTVHELAVPGMQCAVMDG